MKKHLLIAGLICVATIPSAMAVTKCVKLTSSSTCENGYGSGTTFAATCGGTSIRGIAFCSSSSGSGSVGAVSEEISVSSTINNNKYCWCKMITPAISRWVLATTTVSASSCIPNCASSCSHNVQNTASFRTAMFGSLSD